MNKNKIALRILLPLLLIIFHQNLSALNFHVTGREIGSEIKGEYNRALSFSAGLLAFAGVEINNLYNFKGGLFLGTAGGGLDIRTFIRGRAGPFFGKPFYAGLAYIYNGLPSFSVHEHTFLPFISYNGKRAGVSIGTGLRFTRFFGEAAVFESMFSVSAYFNFINNDKLLIGLGLGNFNDFYAGNFSSFTLSVNGLVRLNSRWAVSGEISILQSGSTAFAANFYGVSFQGGARFTW